MRFLRSSLILGLFLVLLMGSIGSAQATSYHANGLYRFKDFAAIYHEGLFHIYAIHECPTWAPPGSCDSTRRGFRHLTSPDLTTWTEVGFVLPPDERSWRSTDVWAPSVVERDGIFYMFYTAVERQTNGLWVQRISVATSTDLYNWIDDRTQPVFSCEAFDWSYWSLANTDGVSADCRDPYVTWNEAEQEWVMFVSARMEYDELYAPWLYHPMVIGVATSPDLENWTAGPTLDNTKQYVAESAHVFEHDGLWYLAWTINTSIKYSVGPTQTGPFMNIGSFPNVSSASFASEVLELGDDDYLMYAQSGSNTLEFRQLGWNTGFPSAGPIGYGTVSVETWNDDDADGTRSAHEPFLSGVSMRLYRDNGDGNFSEQDFHYVEFETGDLPGTPVTEVGQARRTTLLPGRYFLKVDQADFNAGGSLEGMVSGPIQTFDIVSGQIHAAQVGLTNPGVGGSAPAVPAMLAPTDGLALSTFTPNFEFSSLDPENDSLIYDVQIDRVPTFDSAELRLIRSRGALTGWSGLNNGVRYESGSLATYTPAKLGNGIFYWRVRAMDPLGSGNFSGFSPAATFTTPAALTLADVAATPLDANTVRVTWISSNQGSSNVWYEYEIDYYATEPGPTTSHEIVLTNLVPETTYSFEVWTTDVYGQTTVSNYSTFTTLPEEPLTITDVHIYPGIDTAMIVWGTNRPATSVASYGITSAYGYDIVDSTPREYHVTYVNGLSASRNYYVRLQAAGTTTAVWTGSFRTNSWSPGIGGPRRPQLFFIE